MLHISKNCPSAIDYLNRNIPHACALPYGTPCLCLYDDSHKILAATSFTQISDRQVCTRIACDPNGCFNYRFIKTYFDVAFNELGCERISGSIQSDNVKSWTCAERMGFKREGCLRKAVDDNTDIYLYALLKEECRWIRKSS